MANPFTVSKAEPFVSDNPLSAFYKSPAQSQAEALGIVGRNFATSWGGPTVSATGQPAGPFVVNGQPVGQYGNTKTGWWQGDEWVPPGFRSNLGSGLPLNPFAYTPEGGLTTNTPSESLVVTDLYGNPTQRFNAQEVGGGLADSYLRAGRYITPRDTAWLADYARSKGNVFAPGISDEATQKANYILDTELTHQVTAFPKPVKIPTHDELVTTYIGGMTNYYLAKFNELKGQLTIPPGYEFDEDKGLVKLPSDFGDLGETEEDERARLKAEDANKKIIANLKTLLNKGDSDAKTASDYLKKGLPLSSLPLYGEINQMTGGGLDLNTWYQKQKAQQDEQAIAEHADALANVRYGGMGPQYGNLFAGKAGEGGYLSRATPPSSPSPAPVTPSPEYQNYVSSLNVGADTRSWLMEQYPIFAQEWQTVAGGGRDGVPLSKYVANRLAEALNKWKTPENRYAPQVVYR